MSFKRSNLFLVPYNDNRSWEDRTAEDCTNAGLNPNTLDINLVGTILALSKKRAITAEEMKFFINSNRPVTRLMQRCFSSRTEVVRYNA